MACRRAASSRRLPRSTRGRLVELRGKLIARGDARRSPSSARSTPRRAAGLDRHGLRRSAGRAAISTPVPDATFAGLGAHRSSMLDVPQSTIRFGRPGLARHDPDYIAATVVNHMLGGGVFSARLFHEVREKRGLAYSVDSQLLDPRSRRDLLRRHLDQERARRRVARRASKPKSTRSRTKGPTEEELDKAKKYLDRLLCAALRHLDQDRLPARASADSTATASNISTSATARSPR